MITKRSVAEVIVLTIITCGIYGIYWIYAFSNDVKLYLDDETINPGTEVLLSVITCGIYAIYWMYKFGKLVTTCQEKAGVQVEDNSIIYVILAVFGLSVVNIGLMQNHMNIIIDASYPEGQGA